MVAHRFAGPRILRVVGFTDLVLAIVCLATPVLRSHTSALIANALAGCLLLGAAMLYVMARRMEQVVSEVTAESPALALDRR